jgi:hypothetical protein
LVIAQFYLPLALDRYAPEAETPYGLKASSFVCSGRLDLKTAIQTCALRFQPFREKGVDDIHRRKRARENIKYMPSVFDQGMLHLRLGDARPLASDN